MLIASYIPFRFCRKSAVAITVPLPSVTFTLFLIFKKAKSVKQGLYEVVLYIYPGLNAALSRSSSCIIISTMCSSDNNNYDLP